MDAVALLCLGLRLVWVPIDHIRRGFVRKLTVVDIPDLPRGFYNRNPRFSLWSSCTRAYLKVHVSTVNIEPMFYQTYSKKSRNM